MVDYIRVLLVDDDEIVRMALTGALEQSGFVVTCAAGVPEALKLISGPEPFDVLLSDLHMPGAGDGLTVVSAMRHANPTAVTLLLSAFPEMTGLQATMQIRREEAIGAHVPIVAMTASAMSEERERCLAAGMDDFISKPVSYKVIEQMIIATFSYRN